jgi:2-polyprenyl-3-methyl-5-hydroxy-6-metoxy-1,4-benzoquinol methylase
MKSTDNLSDKYDKLYQPAILAEQTDTGIRKSKPAPLTIQGWPVTAKQALVFLTRPGGRLLEVGCGAGGVLATLAPHFERVVGVELAPTLAAHARQGLAHLPHCQVLSSPVETLLDVVEGPFDCILWSDVVEHVVDVVGVMRTLAQLSRVGTQLVTVTPNVAFLPLRWRLLLGKSPVTSRHYPNRGFAANPRRTILLDGGHVHYFTFRQVELLYRSAGFRPERRLGIAPRFSRLRNVWPTLLSSSVCVSGTFQG